MDDPNSSPKPRPGLASLLLNELADTTADVVITHEDIDRAHDRERVWETRARRGLWSRARLLWLLVGPGILVMLGENDGPSMLAYAATGARFGIGFFLPFVVLTFVMACVVQEMTVRLGTATHRGHAELIFDRFGPFWGWFSMIDLMVGNFLTLVTEFIAIRAGLGFFGIPPFVAVLAAWLVLFAALMAHRYWTWERITLVAALCNLVFVPVALLSRPHWGAIGHALITWKPLPGGLTQETVLMLLANIGATVTPWMLFFQQSAIADKGMTTHDIRFGRVDTVLGAVLAALAALADSPSRLTGVGHIRQQETDRLAALATEINGLGGDVAELPDGLAVRPRPLRGGVFASYDDHRLVMAAAVLGLAVPGIEVENPGTVGKTFPEFTSLWPEMLEGTP